MIFWINTFSYAKSTVGFALFIKSPILQKLVIARELVEQLRLGCSSGGNAADASWLTTTATKKQKTTARSPWLQKGKSWSAGDLAREWFDQMPRSLPRGPLSRGLQPVRVERGLRTQFPGGGFQKRVRRPHSTCQAGRPETP